MQWPQKYKSACKTFLCVELKNVFSYPFIIGLVVFLNLKFRASYFLENLIYLKCRINQIEQTNRIEIRSKYFLFLWKSQINTHLTIALMVRSFLKKE